MAKLPRVTAKVFASNAPQDKIGQFGSAKAGTKVNTSDISTIQGLPAFTTGWTEAVVQGQNYPTIEEMNGVQKVFSQQIAYLFEQGIPEYDSNTTYFIGSVCKIGTADSLTFYVSKVDNNLNNAVTNTSFWLELPVYSKTQMANLSMPNYSKRVNIASSGYVAEENGYIRAIIQSTGNDPYHRLYVNNVEIYRFSRGGDYGSGKYKSCLFPIAKGDTFTWNLTQGTMTSAVFIYLKEV